MKTIETIQNQNKLLIIFLGFALISIIAFVDHTTGHELEFSVFYVFPVYLIILATNQKTGFVISMTSAAILLLIDVVMGEHGLFPPMLILNSIIRLVFFFIITYLLSSLKNALLHERELSHTDYLTKAANSRYFFEIIQAEINRFKRYQRPFTIAYIDIDNFKSVNDQFGHAKGDQVLQTIANSIKKKIRNTDIFARLGGDEFAIFFPETNQHSARAILSKLHRALLGDMQKNNWPTTLSVGVVTCLADPNSTDELMKLADDLLYAAKSSGKNAVHYAVYSG